MRSDGLLFPHQALLEINPREGAREGEQWLVQEIVAASSPPVWTLPCVSLVFRSPCVTPRACFLHDSLSFDA